MRAAARTNCAFAGRAARGAGLAARDSRRAAGGAWLVARGELRTPGDAHPFAGLSALASRIEHRDRVQRFIQGDAR